MADSENTWRDCVTKIIGTYIEGKYTIVFDNNQSLENYDWFLENLGKWLIPEIDEEI